MEQLHKAFTLFLSLLVEAIPFLLLGVILSSSLLFFIDERKLIAIMPRHPILGALVGSCIGFLFPVCECGNVPVARRLLSKGIAPSIAISFLLAAPTINPVVIWSTWVAFPDRPDIVLFRFLFSLTIATTVGSIFSVQTDMRPILQSSLAKRLNFAIDNPDRGDIPMLMQSGTFLLDKPGQPLKFDGNMTGSLYLPKRSFFEVIRPIVENIILELRELGAMLVIGSAIAACVQTFVPREIVLDLGRGTISSIVAMLLLAAIVSICSTVDAFFALSFASTFTNSSLIAFLVFGPMVDIKSVGLMFSIFKPKTIFYILIVTAQLTFLLTIFHSYFF
jgi:uncharacterized membrane protein YraQ (UPF0718 family)